MLANVSTSRIQRLGVNMMICTRKSGVVIMVVLFFLTAQE